MPGGIPDDHEEIRNEDNAREIAIELQLLSLKIHKPRSDEWEGEGEGEGEATEDKAAETHRSAEKMSHSLTITTVMLLCKEWDEDHADGGHHEDLEKEVTWAKCGDVGIDDIESREGLREQTVPEKSCNRGAELGDGQDGRALEKVFHPCTLPLLMPVLTLPFSAMDDREVHGVLEKYRIGLTVGEARAVESMLGRPPTVVEAVIWGIQGSEHCSYKSSRRFLVTLPTKGRHVILGPKEDAGIVAITDGPPGQRWGLCISHESHNHPSQIVPYEGAATGIGGTVRDVACMGARVVGCLDALRLGDLRSPETRTIAREVARGIAGYANPLGVPNLGGDTVFDASYNDACLVNAIAVGIVREDAIIHSSVPEEARERAYDIILVGKPTDRSGFGGAAFASTALGLEGPEQNTGAVQEPNPFLGRHLLVASYALFDWLAGTGNLGHVSFKDLGAGGVVCSTVEQVAERGFGAEIKLDLVHTSLANLPPETIACAETQERFCWICRSTLTQHILRHYNEVWDLPSVAEGARASVIGRVTNGGIYRLTHLGHVVCEARSVDIVKGLCYERPVHPRDIVCEEPRVQCSGEHIILTLPRGEIPVVRSTIGEVFRALLSHPCAASREPIILQYDKSVIGNTLLEAGEADASVIAPLQDLGPEEERWRGIALATDGNPRYGRISPYWQGANAAVEAMCNVSAVGAVPRALTDCLNYGNPEVPEHLFDLAEGVRGIGDAARGVHVDAEPIPVISGNVSLYNCRHDSRAIDPSAIVCCVGILPDARKAVSMQLKHAGHVLFLVGDRRKECGGSVYYHVLEEMGRLPRDSVLGANLPQPDFAAVGRTMTFITDAIAAQFVHACHDISDGGLLLALFEMTLPQRKLGGNIGVEISLDVLRSPLASDVLLFSHTPGFLCEVPPDHVDAFRTLAAAKGVTVFPIGQTLTTANIRVLREGATVFQGELSELRGIWERGLADALAGPPLP